MCEGAGSWSVDGGRAGESARVAVAPGVPGSRADGEMPMKDPQKDSFGFEVPGDEWLECLRRAEAAPPPTHLGEYEVLGEIGRGGQGVVYKARQPRTGRTVALKYLPGWRIAGAAARARFEREIETACSLDHPAVVRVYSAEVIDDHAVIAMECVPGRSIDRWAGDGARSVREIVELFVLVCEGVAHAHQRGVIHRDLKPSNIMVDDHGRPRVLDFGLAKVIGNADASISRASGFLGTPAYAAPEQIGGAPVDTRTDVYALGIVLYELISGERAFGSGGVAAVFDRVRAGVQRPPSAHRAAVGHELDAIVLRACALEPEARYASAAALADDLGRFLSGQTVAAHPPSALYRMRKAARRHRTAAATIVTGLVLLVAFSAVASAMALRLAGQRRQLVSALGSEHAALVEAQSARRDEAAARDQAEKSARRARDASDRARTAAQRSTSAMDFLREILQEAGGSRDPRPDVPMRDVLARAVAELDSGRLADQPEAEHDLRLTIGGSYRGLGLYDAAEPQFRRALALAQRLHGARSVETARVMEFLGRLLELNGRLAEAERLEREGLDIRAAAEGTQSLPYASALGDMASLLDEEGRYAEAEAAYVKALHTHQRAPRPDPLRVGTQLRNIGLEQLEQGRYQEAEATTWRALELIRGSGHADTDPDFRALRNLARIYAATGRAREGAAVLSEVIRKWSAQIGADHQQIARERALLAGIIAAGGDLETALPIFRSALTALEARLPASHPWIVRTRLEMAGALSTRGRDEEAAELAARALQDSQRTPPGGERLIVLSAETLARSLVAMGRDDEAGRMLYQVAAQLATSIGPTDPSVRRCLELGSSLAGGGAPAP